MYPPPPPGGYPPPPPPPGGYPPPPPPPGYGYYYPPPPPPPPLAIVAGPEPKRSFAMPVLIIAAVLSGLLLLMALGINGSVDEGRDEARLASKIVWLLVLCGGLGILDSIRAIYGRWKSALSVGLVHLILGMGLFVLAILLDGAHGVRLSTGLAEVKILGGALVVSGILSLCAIGQVSAYGNWKRAMQGLPPE